MSDEEDERVVEFPHPFFERQEESSDPDDDSDDSEDYEDDESEGIDALGESKRLGYEEATLPVRIAFQTPCAGQIRISEDHVRG